MGTLPRSGVTETGAGGGHADRTELRVDGGRSLSISKESLQVVDGWNTVVDDHGNDMQTVGITGAITRKKSTWSHDYYVGEQFNSINSGARNLYDTTLLLTPNDKVNAYLTSTTAASSGLSRDPIIGSALRVLSIFN
jgi:hypothetical protein